MKKKNLVIFTTLLMIWVSVNSISANVNVNVEIPPAAVTSSTVTVNENQEEMVLQTIKDFCAAKYSGYQEETPMEMLSCSETYEYLSEKIQPFVTEKNYSIEFFLYDLVILNERRNIGNKRTENFEYEIDIISLSIEGNYATCVLDETIAFDDVGIITVQSRLVDEYMFSLLYTEEGWKIYYIYSPSSERFYSSYDKFNSIEEMKADAEIGLQIFREEIENFVPVPLEEDLESDFLNFSPMLIETFYHNIFGLDFRAKHQIVYQLMQKRCQ